jgi:hypothetical protein
MDQLDAIATSDGYRFSQSVFTITVLFDVPPGTPLSAIEFSLDPEAGAIFLAVRGHPPALAGLLYQPVAHYSIRIDGTVCQLELITESGHWPLIISGPCPWGIDAKSLFLLALSHQLRGDSTTAWRCLLQSASQGLIASKLWIGNALLNGNEMFSVESDPRQAVVVLNSIPEASRTPAIRVLLAEAFSTSGDPESGMAVLRRAAVTHSPARWALIDLLRSVDSPSRAALAEIAANLDVLQALGDVKAMYEFAQCLAGGIGVPRDVRRAAQLAERVAQLNPNLPSPFVCEKVPLTAIVSGVAAGVAMLAVGYCFLRRR